MTDQERMVKLTEDVSYLRGKIDQLGRQVNALTVAIQGDEAMGHSGLIWRQNRTEDKVERMFRYGVGIALVILGAALGPEALNLIKLFM